MPDEEPNSNLMQSHKLLFAQITHDPMPCIRPLGRGEDLLDLFGSKAIDPNGDGAAMHGLKIEILPVAPTLSGRSSTAPSPGCPAMSWYMPGIRASATGIGQDKAARCSATTSTPANATRNRRSLEGRSPRKADNPTAASTDSARDVTTMKRNGNSK